MTQHNNQTEIYRFDELYQENIALKERERLCNDLLGDMRTALMEGNYSNAFYYASELRKYAYGRDDCKDIIDACYMTCAEHNVEDALIFFARKHISKAKGRVLPEAFSYLKRLSDRGYIPSFRWLADCYNQGIGCEIDKNAAKRLYLEGMLFGDDFICHDKCRHLYQNHETPEWGTEKKELIPCLVGFYGEEKQKSAKILLAEHILAGEVQEYAPESGIVLLKRSLGYYGLAEYRLGECLLYGIATEEDPVVARELLDTAFWELDDFFYYYGEFNEYEEHIMEDSFQGKQGFINAYERAKALVKEAEISVGNMDGFDYFDSYEGISDPYLIYDKWSGEKSLHIRRNRNSQ